MREALATSRRTKGSDHPDTLVAVNNYSGLLKARGRLEEAEALLREAVATRCRVQPGHPHTMTSIH